MACHDGKRSTCRILGKCLEGRDDLICEKKLSKRLVIEIKMVRVVDAPKTNIKITLKTYLLYLRSAFLMLPSTKGPPLMPVRGGKKEWQQKRSFYVSSGCFFGQKMTEEKLQKATIKCTYGPQNRSGTLDKWTKMLSWWIGKHTRKAKEKRTIWKRVVGVSSKIHTENRR